MDPGTVEGSRRGGRAPGRVAWGMAALVLAAGCLGAAPDGTAGQADAADPDDDGTLPAAAAAPFTVAADDCSETSVWVPTDVARVRAFVPERFALTGREAGRVPVIVNVARCAAYRVNGTAAGPGWQSEVGVFIEAPDDSGGDHVYTLWMLTNVTAVADRIEALGYRGGHVENHTFVEDEDPVGPVRVLAADRMLDWDRGAYATRVHLARATVTYDIQPFWWHLGTAGLVRFAYDVPADGLGGGRGQVDAGSTGPAADLFGPGVHAGAGAYFGLDFEAAVEVVEPAA